MGGGATQDRKSREEQALYVLSTFTLKETWRPVVLTAGLFFYTLFPKNKQTNQNTNEDENLSCK